MQETIKNYSGNPRLVSMKEMQNQFFQPKLTINQPNDIYEQEADTMADKVMRMEQPFIQAKPLPVTPVQRKCAHCEEEENKMQRKEMNDEGIEADSGLENYIGGLSSSGQPLPNEVRNFYEPRFGYDFSNVKLHTDTVAAKSAQSINALAYTSGNNIVFNEGQYSPETHNGKKLLGHELTHVVQQQKSIAPKKIQRSWDWGRAGIGALIGLAAGAAVGAGIGAGIGYLLGGGAGAILGAGVGAGIGALVGLIGGGLIGGLTGSEEKDKKGDAAAKGLEDCSKQPVSKPGDLLISPTPDDILLLQKMFGAELQTIASKIGGDAGFKKFVCLYGIAGIAALVNTQTAEGNFDTVAAEAALTKSASDYTRQRLEQWRIADVRKKKIRNAAESIGIWASTQDKEREDVPNPSAALNMPPEHVVEITEMITNTEALGSHFNNTSKPITDAGAKLAAVIKIYKNAIPSTIMQDSYAGDVHTVMGTAIEDIDAFITLLVGIEGGLLDLTDLRNQADAIKQTTEDIKDKAMGEMKKIVANQTPDYGDIKDLIKDTRSKALKKINEDFSALKDQIEAFSKHIPAIIFVLKYFRALNDSKSMPPDEMQMNEFNGKLESIDTSLFFGSSTIDAGVSIMSSVINFISKQVAVRLAMKKATGKLPGLIPGVGEAEAYFSTMNNRAVTNDEVRKAYEDFAGAYFQHRGEVSVQDLKVDGITDVFSMPASITGTKSIVCGAYAQMGAALMSRAGATKVEFTIAVRATNDQIKNNAIDAGHAIVKVTRQSKIFFISNGTTDDTEVEAMNVMWEHPDFPMHKASDGLYNTAVKKLEDSLSKIK